MNIPSQPEESFTVSSSETIPQNGKMEKLEDLLKKVYASYKQGVRGEYLIVLRSQKFAGPLINPPQVISRSNFCSYVKKQFEKRSGNHIVL